MKKFYYFSDKSLNFLEIKHFKEKLIAIFTVAVLLTSSLLLGFFYLISNLSNEHAQLQALKTENSSLKEKVKSLANDYKLLSDELNNVRDFSDQLRLAANLEPLTIEERLLGIGGKKNISFSGFGADIDEALDIIDEVKTKFEFEKSNYETISAKLKTNSELFESIPAIIPTKGTYSVQSYGNRLHPILKVYRKHNGLDILNDIGTPVKSTGKGKVVFLGNKGGYGLAIEIDHGFGYRTIYGHLSKSLVKEGQTVKRGDLIAKSGNSGLSSGPHLHYEVLHNGQNLNPADFFFDEYNYFE
jgi:murein DD-endopeptidase MepM/ murein hydrolase activator NlpD